MAWKSSVILACKCDNSNADDTGNYTPADKGTPVYDAVIKHDGTHSFETTNLASNNNCIELPLQLATDINALDTFSISFWAYQPTGSSFSVYAGKGDALQTGFFFAYTDDNTDRFVYRWHDSGSVELAEFDGTDLDTWINWAFTWDGTAGGNGVLKVYKNNSLINTHVAIGSSFTNVIENDDFFIGATGFTAGFHTGYTDNYIITDDIPASFPVTDAGRQKILLGEFNKTRIGRGEF